MRLVEALGGCTCIRLCRLKTASTKGETELSHAPHSCWHPLRSRKGHDGPHFNRSKARPGNLGRDGNRLVAARSLHQVVASKLLLRLGEGPVRGHRLAVAHAHSSGGLGGLQSITSLDRRSELLAKRVVFFEFRLVVVLTPTLLVVVNQQQVLHFSSPSLFGFVRRARRYVCKTRRSCYRRLALLSFSSHQYDVLIPRKSTPAANFFCRPKSSSHLGTAVP